MNGNNRTQWILIERPQARDDCDSMDRWSGSDVLHMATVIKDRGPGLGAEPQILDSFRQNRLKFGPNLNRGQGHQIKFRSR